VHLLTADVPAGCQVRVTVSDAMSPIDPNLVLRADAIQCQWIGEIGSTAVASPHQLPQTTALMQNYPNPFNPTTKIQFSIADRQWTTVRLFDVLGREAATLVNEVKEPGTYTVEFDGSNLASGVYVCTLTAGSLVQSRKIILVR
jgi:Secretion system C-terminal sorting domain